MTTPNRTQKELKMTIKEIIKKFNKQIKDMKMEHEELEMKWFDVYDSDNPDLDEVVGISEDLYRNQGQRMGISLVLKELKKMKVK